jgi:hypothetical protein
MTALKDVYNEVVQKCISEDYGEALHLLIAFVKSLPAQALQMAKNGKSAVAALEQQIMLAKNLERSSQQKKGQKRKMDLE